MFLRDILILHFKRNTIFIKERSLNVMQIYSILSLINILSVIGSSSLNVHLN